MSYYNNYNKGEYSGGNRYQPYKKKEKGESSYWKSKGFTKERQEDRYNEDDVAEKLLMERIIICFILKSVRESLEISMEK